MDEMGGPIYSVGYERLTLADLVDRLVEAGISVVVDVRLRASSRRPGFAKTALKAALAGAGITYIHEKQLGNPPENRASFQSGDGSQGRVVMRARLSSEGSEALARVTATVRTRRVALLCIEQDPRRCHRTVIIEAILEQHPHLVVVPIG